MSFEPNGILTLTTDFGSRDGYVGAMKGAVLSIERRLDLVDIAHDLPAQGVVAAAIALRTACPRFPRGTVHLAVIDPGVGTDRAAIVAVAGGHLFVGPDNGLLMPALTRILDHVGIKSIAPSFKSARGPPQQHWCEDNWD